MFVKSAFENPMPLNPNWREDQSRIWGFFLLIVAVDFFTVIINSAIIASMIKL